MYGQLSSIDPLDYLTGTNIAEGPCRLTQCQTHCGNQGTIAGGVNLNEIVVRVCVCACVRACVCLVVYTPIYKFL